VSQGYYTFIKELPKSFKQIGGVIPSSPYLAKLMIKPICKGTTPQNILEVGPGTGPFTRAILKEMGKDDTLTVCEVNPRFIAKLKDSLQNNNFYKQHQSRVSFYEGPVEQLVAEQPDLKFDVIVSSLPFNCFTEQQVAHILSAYKGMLKVNGSLTFCEYLGMPALAKIFASPEQRERISAVKRTVKFWLSEASTGGRVKKRVSILNLPPALTFEVNTNGVNGHHHNGHSLDNLSVKNLNGNHTNGSSSKVGGSRGRASL